MTESKKKILAFIGFIAICAVFSFAYLIINQGKETEPVLANEPQEQQEKDSSSTETEGAGEEKVSLSNSISLSKEETKETTPAATTEEDVKEENEETSAEPEQMTLAAIKALNGGAYIKDGQGVKKIDVTVNGWSPTELFMINGMEYQDGIGFNVDYGSRSNMSIPALRYPLQEKYTSLTGEVGVDDAYVGSGSTYRIDFLSQEMDNSYRDIHSVEVKAGNFATPFEIDITGVKMLVVELVKLDDTDKEIRVALVNTQLN